VARADPGAAAQRDRAAGGRECARWTRWCRARSRASGSTCWS
jgi:hypothetical protein